MKSTNLAFRLEQLAKPLKSLIRNINPSLIRFNSAKREILSWYWHLCQRIKKGRFTYIRQSNLTKKNNFTHKNTKKRSNYGEIEGEREITMPILRWEENRPRIGLSDGASFDFDAFGGMFWERGIWFRVLESWNSEGVVSGELVMLGWRSSRNETELGFS